MGSRGQIDCNTLQHDCHRRRDAEYLIQDIREQNEVYVTNSFQQTGSFSLVLLSISCSVHSLSSVEMTAVNVVSTVVIESLVLLNLVVSTRFIDLSSFSLFFNECSIALVACHEDRQFFQYTNSSLELK